MNIKSEIKLSVTHKLRSYHKDGTLHQELPEITNMITDAGLEQLATYYYGEVTQYLHIGDAVSPTPTSRSIASLSQSGTTVTDAAGSFTVAEDDAGNLRVIKFLDGTYAICSARISDTQMTVDRSQTVTAQEAVVLNVEQTALDSEQEADDTYQSTGNGATGTAVGDIIYLAYTRYSQTTGTYVSGLTVTEIGLSPAGGSLFARLVLDTPIEIPPSGYIINTNVFHVQIDAGTQVLTAPITNISEDATARMCVRALNDTISMGTMFSGITTAGDIDSPSGLQAMYSGETCSRYDKVGTTPPVLHLSDDISAFTSISPNYGVTYANKDLVAVSYVAGSFEKAVTIGQDGAYYASTVWRTIAMISDSTTDYYDYRMIWDTDQIFLVGDVIQVTFTKSWRRA